jgi:hypothetical protein
VEFCCVDLVPLKEERSGREAAAGCSLVWVTSIAGMSVREDEEELVYKSHTRRKIPKGKIRIKASLPNSTSLSYSFWKIV